MLTQVERLGDGLAVRIPAGVADAAGLVVRQPIELDVVGGELVLRSDPDAARLLDELVFRITPANRYGETNLHG